jgi:hypothetical protein
MPDLFDVNHLSDFFISLLIRRIPGTTIMASPISTPIDSAMLTPKLGYLNSETIPRRIKRNPKTVFILIDLNCYEILSVIEQ